MPSCSLTARSTSRRQGSERCRRSQGRAKEVDRGRFECQVRATSRESQTMKKAVVLVSAAIIGVLLLSGRAGAQGTPQTVDLVKVDVQKLSAGYRASKVVGSSVVNDANETIGKIDDLLVSSDGKEPYAVLSIGGFLGMGTHLVVVPYDTLKFADNKVILPGGTKEGLKMLPEF